MINLIAISGTGRTGSTLLSVILSQNKQCFNVGQIRDFWKAYLLNAPCTCAVSLQDCEKWAKIVELAFGPAPEQDLKNMHQMTQSFMAYARAHHQWSDQATRALARQKHQALLLSLNRFFNAVQHVTGTDYLLDASKSPEIAYLFSLVPDTHLSVINLVRDPRAVCSSWNKKLGRDFALNQSVEWGVRQILLRQWSTLLGNRFVQVRYEDFTTSPRFVMEQLSFWAFGDGHLNAFTSDDAVDVSWTAQHLYPPANERFIAERKDHIVISEATEWRKEKDLALHAHVNEKLAKLLPQYGYVLSPIFEKA